MPELNSKNLYRNLHKFRYAERYLESSETSGKIISRLDGEFDVFCSTYGTAIVNLQKRVPDRVFYYEDGDPVDKQTRDRTYVAATDYDGGADISIVQDSGSVYDLSIDEQSADVEEIPNGYFDDIVRGVPIRLEVSTTVNWEGTILSITRDNADDEQQVVVKINFHTRTGSFTVNDIVTIKIGFTEDATEWRNMQHNGEEVTFEAAGETKVVNFSRNYEYRFNTDTAGSIIYVDPIWQNTIAD